MIHPLTNIHPDAKIGNNVTIESFTSIAADVVIDEGTWIGSNVTIMAGSRIGKNNRIFPGAVIGAIPQDLKFQGEYTLLEIGDNNTIRECVTLNRGTKSRNTTKIGNNNLLMAYVHVGHDCIIGNMCILGNAVQVAGEVEIDDWAIIGGTTAIHQFSKIGKHTMVGGALKVLKDIPPYAKAGREPISFVGLNILGLRRRNFSRDIIDTLQNIYRIIYLSNLNVSQAVALIETEVQPSEQRDDILAFIKSSKRGIMRGYKGSDSDDE